MIDVLLVLAGVACGSVLGWLACQLHWHARLAESWDWLRASVWRRQSEHVAVRPDRAVDVTDVTGAFGFGMIAEDELEAGSGPMAAGGISADSSPRPDAGR